MYKEDIANMMTDRKEKSMKTLTITYDAFVVANGQKLSGETCMNITIMKDVAERLLKTGKSGIAIAEIEKALAPLERLKGRTYIKGSIKDIRESKQQQ